MNRLICSDCVQAMLKIPKNSIDLTVTSPPYDKLRDYKGYLFPFKRIARLLYIKTKPGGVVVWVVGDATVKGSETGTSFKQALYFISIGFNLHDTQIYAKNSFAFPSTRRYHQVFEYCFIFTKPRKIKYKYPRFDFPFLEKDAAWLASAIDGEGCIRIVHNRRSDSENVFSGNITVGNTSKKYVDRCLKITKCGGVYGNNMYEWVTYSDDAAKIIAEIYPYLIIKKEQAKVFLEFQSTLRKQPHCNRGHRLSKSEIRVCNGFYKLMGELNQRKVFTSKLPEPDLRIIKNNKDLPKTFNPIKDRKNKYRKMGGDAKRQKDGTIKKGNKGGLPLNEFGQRFNIWTYKTGGGLVSSNRIAHKHPAIFPEQLAIDHVKSWSNPGDIVLDPMMGSGTTCIAAKMLGRKYIGIDVSKEYYFIAQKRLKDLDTKRL